jgi:hypothetical protein
MSHECSPEPSLPPAIASLRKAINGLGDTAHKLEERLGPVLRAGKSVPKSEEPPRDAVCPMTDEVRGASDDVADTQRVLDNIFERLEV